VVLDFGFNAWGLKFAADLDNQITGKLTRLGGFGRCPVRIPGLILEGGSIESDGAGTLLTTRPVCRAPTAIPISTAGGLSGPWQTSSASPASLAGQRLFGRRRH
jgi:agmatine deiminase